MNDVGVSVTAFLVWTNYLKAKSSGRMAQRYGPLPVEEEMPERGGGIPHWDASALQMKSLKT